MQAHFGYHIYRIFKVAETDLMPQILHKWADINSLLGIGYTGH